MDTVKIDRKQTKMIAHRGLSGIEKENTLSAFVAAGNRSYFGVETDVHLTADGQYIIFHDDTTTRVALDTMVIEQTTFETLRKLRLTDIDGKRGRADLVMPSLDEYIGVCKKYEKVCVLELKNHFEPDAIEEILDIIKAREYIDRMIFISFDLPNCTYLKGAHPEYNVQFLISTYSDELLATLKQYHLDLDIHYKALNEENMKILHGEGITVNCWTVNDKDAAEQLISWGVDYITTNILE